MLTMNFTAIDFETANCERSSICAVGIVRVENDETVETYKTLINPQTYFDFRCVAVHGITQSHVQSAPTFQQAWRDLQPFLRDNVVAHNAPFDISCLKAALAEFRPPDAEEFDYICTLAISRRLYGRGGNRLNQLAEKFALGGFKHHDAFDDASICAELFKIFQTRIDISVFKKRFLPPF